MEFESGNDYNNVYFMSVDAAGHSSIVSNNDADKVDAVFDGFETMVYAAVDEAKGRQRCQIAEFWGWQGDGGLCIFYDADEGRARQAALNSASIILGDLSALNDRITRNDVRGALSVRVAIHKGHFRYKGDDHRGSIHSRDLNFCAHLEKALPANCIGISKDVYQISEDPWRDRFHIAESTFEDQTVYISGNYDAGELAARWQQTGSSGQDFITVRTDLPDGRVGLRGIFAQRALTAEFRDLCSAATERLWVMGIGLGGFRADHSTTVHDLRVRGVEVKLLCLDPDQERAAVHLGGTVASMPAWCDAETANSYNSANAADVGAWVNQCNEQLVNDGIDVGIELKYYSVVPSAALFIVDDVVFVSPYLGTNNNVKLATFEFDAIQRGGAVWVERFDRVWNSSNAREPDGEYDA